jgi:DNA mismatch repair protein MutL
MHRRIQQLPPAVVTKIAAGEVIERPASVAKELLENAVDAGSTRIDLAVEQGGIDRVQVVDDGCGIPSDDLPLAFASHATSKLADADDLFRITTLGFRGEALASIGGVAQVTLQSRTHDQPAGAEISCHGGERSSVGAWNGAPGTRLEVRHLFYNTPVRRKFLRTPATELGHVSEAFTRIALAHPTLHLTLRHNGKSVYEVAGNVRLPERLGLFFGREVRDRLYEIDTAHGPVQLRGYIADPSCDRGNARMQYLFVNRRWVRDRSLGHAIQEAYRGLLMTGRYAIVFLALELPPDEVDVNVHPTKCEVRFRDSHALHQFVLGALRERLRAANLTARLQVPAGPSAMMLDGVAPRVAPTPVDRGVDVFRMPPAAAPGPAAPVLIPAETFKAIQLYDAYLVLETEEGMLVIDQHALHERVLFEQLKGRVRDGTLETQRLLIPEPVELTPEQAARTLEHKAALAELGVGVEDFGGGTLLLTSYPALLGDRSPQAVLRAVVDHLVATERPPSREQLLGDLLSLMACHAAVKAGDRLTPEQIAALVAQRALAQDAHHCPHGRPTALLFSRYELDRQFRRV